jgi:hypothetical protein
LLSDLLLHSSYLLIHHWHCLLLNLLGQLHCHPQWVLLLN